MLISDIDYPSDETLALWPDCAITGCSNKCCKAKNSIYCWPHTGAGKNLEDLISEINEKELVEI